MSYAVVEQTSEVGSVERRCRTLGVSVSGYYAWRSRQPSQRQQRDAVLLAEIQVAYQAGRELYGSPRVHAVLRHNGVRCSRKRVARLMRQAHLISKRRPKRRLRTTDSRHNRPVAANRLKRDFSATAPNQKWVGDIVGIETDEGPLYLAALLDVYSRRIIGWAMSDKCDKTLVIDALKMALAHRQPSTKTELIHHTDRGSQYTADDYLTLLREHHFQPSMSRKADPYDNAMIESFFSTLRAELTDLQHFPSRPLARLGIFEFIEAFYNQQRLHSSLGYLSPAAFEAAVPI